MTKYKTAESVRKGHPDKLCDIIADSILDECMYADKASRVACEVMATEGKIFVAGEITCSKKVDIKAKGKDYANLYELYEEAQERGNELIDISDVVWDDKVEALIASFREYGIERFTFSSGWSGAVETAWKFTENGCRLERLVEINGHCKAFMSNDYEKKHGYLFSVN